MKTFFILIAALGFLSSTAYAATDCCTDNKSCCEEKAPCCDE